MDIIFMVWLFPILFMFHDFEEILFMEQWIRNNKSYLGERVPRLSKKLIKHFVGITTASFAFGVAEEFLLVSMITIIAYLQKWYYLWAGLFIAFTVHLLIHILQAIILRKYIPALITSILCLPVCIWFVISLFQLLDLWRLTGYTVLGLVLMIVNLILVHRAMDIFGKSIRSYDKSTTGRCDSNENIG